MNNKEREPRILVLTLYSGENEIDACRQSVGKQKNISVTHEVLENLPNIEAHRQLYARIMKQSPNYDWFVKLDADMVLNDENALSKAISHIHNIDKNAGMAIFTVQDYPTNMPIWGINFFSACCHWDWVKNGEDIPDDLFVDPDPEFKGKRLIIDKSPSPIASHMQNPSDWQAFFFGAHRALKALAVDRNRPSTRSKTQWNILRAVGKHYSKNNSRQLALILAGAEYIRSLEKTKKLPTSLNKDDKELLNTFENFKKSSQNELHRLTKFWRCPITSAYHWYFKRAGWRLIVNRFF